MQGGENAKFPPWVHCGPQTYEKPPKQNIQRTKVYLSAKVKKNLQI
jgi:hypothetical protein